MKRVITIIIVVVVALGAIAYVLSNNKKKNEEKTAFIAKGGGAVAVRVAQVERKAVNLDFSANGNFIPKQELNFLSENAGRVTAIYVDEGDRVSKGQVLARVDAEIINTDRETAEATYQNAVRDEARYQSSFSTGGVTQQQLDQAKLATKNAKLRLQASQRRLSDANIKSPINGIVNKRYIEVGAFVNTQGTQLFELVDVSKLKLKVNVNESQVANLKIGDQIEIKSSVFPTDNFSGKVTFIAAKADATLNFPIEIEVENSHKNTLKAGMYGTAIFKFPKQAPSILIPRTSFVGSVSSNQVFVLDKSNNTSKIRNVVAGRILGDNVEILDGLKEGETVITSGQINLTEGTAVSIVK
ncbi:Toluene efflux pump periplasmic linker protein TtgG [Pedobacter sp. Bi27]|uniref:efflux RND transporter periplasmic adaptor subunit n=1 Tax=unclassified Pedobacter TaxID=2628915 RepID=UPI001DE06F54|nr:MULTISPECIES: efflux RND transporter periplasmic adaptor subunit [unclassified Pedobacter]CAH0159762.1 Toluene efflux pump periplasmic linker protein TtgG [Pedobacter sp. Bi36]CAH0183951.1 Toluene efflux pump periplasmic linker protein TtgG [Pedobacter sp. Bi27]CAH0215569.1 Toluene efflux pump periplasmic linker protein TtgG [Pedobacter sp. Bi126]